MQIKPGSEDFLWGHSGWRILFFVGILPALLVVPMIFVLREPEAWKQARSGHALRSVGSPIELFRDVRWRRNTVAGLLLGVSGMIGLWAIGFYSPELISTALKGAPQETVDTVRGLGTALQDVGAFVGMMVFTVASPEPTPCVPGRLSCAWSRRSSFASPDSDGCVLMLPRWVSPNWPCLPGTDLFSERSRHACAGPGGFANTVRYLAARFRR
jgi:MFS family permease